ncbi:glutaryl-CoA dehydrogenase [Bradyrhizobium japonicum]|uniref:acyl-CoA dehydrogenase family protein n=1 Tax=Bradyrhizobium japonicum TaxID=375 RepID=UPI002166FA5E|nr:acyl-CoA dehydrogenase family protein [Bradyrhizobium japonicum]MCS3496160.1 glutaryl-CoA dehydrogenase [Bradyrhizobium japonicum]MCS3961678.1 glutaryl-CoA dehydrogenase [Bradyrhizobium japonicum]MCS3993995.1 glutaryl-CoA dehydrogenase [Bradyrhizobium japonicum]
MSVPTKPITTEEAVFHWDDPLRLDLQLTDVEKEIQRMASEYAQESLLPRVLEAHRTENYEDIPCLVRELGRNGFLGINLHGFGFLGLNHVCYGLVSRELERVDSAYRTVYSVQSSLATEAIYLNGSAEQKETYLPGLAKGELIACFGLTEPNHGSDPGSMETRAAKVPGGYQLDGHKKWIGLATMADILVTWAKDEEGIVRGFIIEKGIPGLSAENIEGKFSLRAAPTCEFRLDKVFVPEANMLPKAKGLSAPFRSLNKARFSIAWGVIGAAEACWKIARDYTLQRKQFGRPLAANQLIQRKLADMETQIALMSQACLRVARLLDEGQCPHEVISLVKRHCAKTALEIALTARDMLGANGIIDEHHVIRHVLNLMAVNTYEGTEDVHALILGRAQTGISAFS